MDHEAIDQLAGILTVPFVRVRNRAIAFVAALLKQMDIVVTNDTGIMHLAAAVGTSTLSLFGPTDPLQWAPLGRNHKFILGRGGDINTIEVSKVFDSVMKLTKLSKG
jgi:heptosyltransferase-2